MKEREGYKSEQIRDESFGELDGASKMQQVVYKCIMENAPISNETIGRKLKLRINSVTPRVKELRELGYVEFAGEGKSRTTGRKVSMWRPTPVQPQFQMKF